MLYYGNLTQQPLTGVTTSVPSLPNIQTRVRMCVYLSVYLDCRSCVLFCFSKFRLPSLSVPLSVNAAPIAAVIPAGTQVQQLITMTSVGSFNELPTLHLSFVCVPVLVALQFVRVGFSVFANFLVVIQCKWQTC